MTIRGRFTIAIPVLVAAVVLMTSAAITVPAADSQIGDEAVAISAAIAQLPDENAVSAYITRLVSTRAVTAIRVVDGNLATLASANTTPGTDEPLVEDDVRSLTAAMDHQRPGTRVGSSSITAMAPLANSQGEPTGAILVQMPLARLFDALRGEAGTSATATFIVLLFSLAASIFIARLLSKPITRISRAAAELDAYTLRPESVNNLAQRTDEVGNLARILQRMGTTEAGVETIARGAPGFPRPA